jgi:hypothetical protein
MRQTTQTTFHRVCLILLLAAGPLRAQVESGAAPAGVATDMVVPSIVNVEGVSLAFAAETERTNYLVGGLSVSSAYDDDLLTPGVSDVSYSVRPSIAIDESGPRLHWNLFYRPGFTFYPGNTLFNQADHDLAADFRYRLSPHITVTLRNNLTKSSALSYPSDPNPIGPGTGILQSPNQSVISPITDIFSNNANGQITYQFSANGMIGASGTETEQRYLHPSQVPGLFNSSTRSAMAFYTHRVSGKQYLGATYQFQQLLSHPNGTETQTHSAFLFYTLYLNPMVSLSLFGGPQHFETSRLGIPTEPGWSPAGGVTLGWQRRRTSGNFSFAHRITDGGGLQSAVVSTSADLSMRQQLTKNLTVSLAGSYTNNSLVGPMSGNNGHTAEGGLSFQRTIGEHSSLQLGYRRSHQSYIDIPAIFGASDRNRAWVSYSYTFHRPLGR